MTCSRCGRENPDGLKFCQDCGNRLNAPAPATAPAPAAAPNHAATALVEAPRVEVIPRPGAPAQGFAAAAEKRCVRCGTSNPHNGRFCANCGSPLPGDASAAQPAAAPAPAPAIVNCPRCRGANAVHMAFCQYCGARVGEGGPAPPAAMMPAPAGVAIAAAVGPAAASPFAPGTSFQFGAAERAEQRAKLVVIGQDGKPGREYEIEGEQTDIGREEGSILLVNDPYVSPRHARLQFRDGRFFIRDHE